MTQQYLPPPHHQPYHGAPMPPQRSNGVATAGFVVALCGAVLSIIPLLGIVAWIVAPIGIVLSIVGLTRVGQLGGRGMAVSGVVLGVVGLFICLLWLIGFAAATTPTSGSTYTPPSYSYSAPSYSAPARSAAPSTSSMPSVNGPFTSGTYLVGTEIAPGQYRTDGDSFCGWSRNEDTSGEFDAIIANGLVNGPTTVTVQASDGAVEFSGSCVWTRR